MVEFWWNGDTMFARNTAVNDQYLPGWSRNPGEARASGAPSVARDRLLLWHANCTPTAASSFPRATASGPSPHSRGPDEVTPQDFVTFYYIDGGRGLYLHPNVWHEAVFPLVTPARFHDERARRCARPRPSAK